MDMDENQANNHHDGAEGKETPETTTIPKAILVRMMRQAMPGNSKIASDAKEVVDQCVAEFTTILMRAATLECRRDRRSTVTGDDLILALRSLGFDDYVGPLSLYLRRYRESNGTMPRAQYSSMAASLPSPAPVVEAAAQPPSPGLTLQLGPPSLSDVTELGLHTDVYAVWRAGAQAGTSQMPPDADGDDDDQ